jgi:hypothetical protein
MRNIDIDQTLTAIRQLPPEVEIERIEQLVNQQPKHQGQSGNGQGLMKFSYLMIILAIATATIIALVFNLNIPEKQTSEAVAFEPAAKKIPEPPAIPQINESDKSPQKEPVPIVSKKQGLQAPKVPVVVAPAIEEVSDIETEVAEPEQTNEIIADEIEEEESYLPLRVRTYTSSFCNFDGEDAWINAFVRALIREKIIIDTSNLHFTISRNFFEVNGKKQSAIVVTKYNELYTSITEVELNNRSRISLSVGESSCSLSKTIDE